MNNPFSQQKVAYKIYFEVKYKFLELFESYFPEETPGICSYEVSSETIDPMPEDIWSIEVFFFDKPDIDNLTASLESYGKEKSAELESKIKLSKIEDKDWVKEYQAQLKPIIIDNFVITSSREYIGNKTPIIIEASRAFGTGEHETTSLCIQAMNLFKTQDINNIFDIGTGSGILSFAAEKIWPLSKIIACDLDETAVEIATHNAGCNDSCVQFHQNSEENFDFPQKSEMFDLVLANILCDPLINMASDIYDLTVKGSVVILSGFLDYQVEKILVKYTDVGYKHYKTLQKEKWCCMILQK